MVDLDEVSLAMLALIIHPLFRCPTSRGIQPNLSSRKFGWVRMEYRKAFCPTWSRRTTPLKISFRRNVFGLFARCAIFLPFSLAL